MPVEKLLSKADIMLATSSASGMSSSRYDSTIWQGIVAAVRDAFKTSFRIRERSTDLQHKNPWRLKELGWTSQEGDKQFRVSDHAWPYLLEGKFEVLVCDEANFIKSVDINNHTSVSWIKPDFTILVSATLWMDSARDFEGLVALIERPGLWNNIPDQNVNPYTAEDEEDGPEGNLRVLQCTRAAFRRYITHAANNYWGST
ncbi:MAG: hypothetical protein Q9170_003805 [Blastenia crenularia]